ncbi:MAG: hydroxyethylthiazole kinase [Bacteroidales bacterium]|nr:hydroxyethylthiazole kinase [Bacteroidales bacterium]
MEKLNIWRNIENVKQSSPLVHNITNYVAMNNTANALLASGASPVMAHAEEEVEGMVTISGALVINIGTLSRHWVAAMKKALIKARLLNKPVILDPVGAGATSYRNRILAELLETGKFSAIRANASEILSLASVSHRTKGVDSTNTAEEALKAAQYLSQKYECTISVSGPEDYIINKEKKAKILNGHPIMSKVTAMGCTATAIAGAFLAVEPDTFQAVFSAMAFMGVAGELAAKISKGPGSFQVNFLDKLYNISKDEFLTTIKFSNYEY